MSCRLGKRDIAVELTEAETHRVNIMAEQLANLNDDEMTLWMLQVGKISEEMLAQERKVNHKLLSPDGLIQYVEYSMVLLIRQLFERESRPKSWLQASRA